MRKRYPKNGKRWYQGHYNPINKEKYKGKFPIHWRSSWELQFCRFADMNPGIIQWGCESFIVNYLDETRKNSNGSPTIHKYYVDFNITVRQKDGSLQKYFVEIKPFCQTIAPVQGKKANKTYLNEAATYIRNQCKWKAAEVAAQKCGGKFVVITEKDLNHK